MRAKITHAGFHVRILGLGAIAKTNVAARRNAKKQNVLKIAVIPVTIRFCFSPSPFFSKFKII